LAKYCYEAWELSQFVVLTQLYLVICSPLQILGICVTFPNQLMSFNENTP